VEYPAAARHAVTFPEEFKTVRSTPEPAAARANTVCTSAALGCMKRHATPTTTSKMPRTIATGQNRKFDSGLSLRSMRKSSRVGLDRLIANALRPAKPFLSTGSIPFQIERFKPFDWRRVKTCPADLLGINFHHELCCRNRIRH